MSIKVAERLKAELTDKYVLVTKNVPELRRFEGLTGTVKTVNMNGRALVQFDSAEDISWYDIDPAYLTVVDAPLPKKKAEPAAVEAKPKAAKPAGGGKATAGMSPLEAARAQGTAGGATPAKKAASPLEAARAQGSGGGAKPASPLEAARQQGAAGGGAAPSKSDKPLSPLEAARQQGASGGEESPAPAEEPPAEKPASDVDLSKLSPLERARLEGGGK